MSDIQGVIDQLSEAQMTFDLNQIQQALIDGQQMLEQCKAEIERLRKAVSDVYYAAHWTPDRPCDAGRLWTDLRDAAGLKPGNAPKPKGVKDE